MHVMSFFFSSGAHTLQGLFAKTFKSIKHKQTYTVRTDKYTLAHKYVKDHLCVHPYIQRSV